MASYEKIDKKAHNCCTCDYWDGERSVEPMMKFVVYNTFQREMCRGGGMNGEKTTPMMRCKRWRMWKKVRRNAQSILLEEQQREESLESILDQMVSDKKSKF